MSDEEYEEYLEICGECKSIIVDVLDEVNLIEEMVGKLN